MHLKNKNKIDKCKILGEPLENLPNNTEKVNYSKFSIDRLEEDGWIIREIDISNEESDY